MMLVTDKHSMSGVSFLIMTSNTMWHDALGDVTLNVDSQHIPPHIYPTL